MMELPCRPAARTVSPAGAQRDSEVCSRFGRRLLFAGWLCGWLCAATTAVGCESAADSDATPGAIPAEPETAPGTGPETAPEPETPSEAELQARAELERQRWSFAEPLHADGEERSGLGESCGWTDDCRTDLGLVCIGGQCAATAVNPDDDTQAATRRTGGAGESCEARQDCDSGLACIGDVCVQEGGLPPEMTDAGGAPELNRGANGESCRSRSDCNPGLACLNQRCIVSSAGLAPSAKACVVVDCQEPIDCCPASTDNCAELQAACAESEPDSLICTRYEATCNCDGSIYSCLQGECGLEFSCSDTVLCPGLLVCDDGNCVRCVTDSDCPGGARCTDDECAQACEGDAECGRFHQCLEGACVDVGCQTDRECKAFLTNLEAICEGNACFSTCASDLNCGAADGSNRICVDGTCVDAGCETDEECRIQRSNGLLDPVADPNSEAFAVECRAVTTSSEEEPTQ